jgi:hypothetical protein
MIINWEKYTRWMLPTFLRTREIVEFLRVLMWQVPKKYSEVEVWAEEAKYRANVTASKISLEKLIEREFGVRAEISELDGKPVDFLINVSGTVDEVRLKSLIDSHKLLGKSYQFRIGEVAFNANWLNHVCEDIIEVWTARFEDYVCESDGVNTITLLLSSVGIDQLRVTASASSPVQSYMTITGTISGEDSSGHIVPFESFTLNMLPDTSSEFIDVNINMQQGYAYFIDMQTAGVDPENDLHYEYILSE